MGITRKTKDKEEVKIQDLIAAEEELSALKQQYGIADNPEDKKGIFYKLAGFFERQAEHEKVLVNKKRYIILALLTGWFGGHRFYSKSYKVGLLYLLFFWIGIGIYHTIIDLMIVLPMKPDENGDILI